MASGCSAGHRGSIPPSNLVFFLSVSLFGKTAGVHLQATLYTMSTPTTLHPLSECGNAPPKQPHSSGQPSL